jgi:signal transduction histidine kinase
VLEYILPVIGTIITALVTWFFARRKTNAEAKMAEIDNEVKAAEFYRGLLDDASNRIKEFVAIIENLNNKIEERDNKIEERDIQNNELKKHIAQLLVSNESLIKELQKFKQLNGKA